MTVKYPCFLRHQRFGLHICLDRAKIHAALIVPTEVRFPLDNGATVDASGIRSLQLYLTGCIHFCLFTTRILSVPELLLTISAVVE